MDIILINPPFKGEYGKFSREQRSPAITKSGTFYYPMWLAYAAGYLLENNVECLLIDAPALKTNFNQIINIVKKNSPKILVVDTSTPSIYNDIEFAAKLKEEIKDLFVILVGPHVSALPEETLKINSKINAVAIGEYENTLLELFNELNKPFCNMKDIKGIAYNNGKDIIINKNRELENNLDKFPFVSKSYKRFLNYKDYFYSHSKYPIITTITGRGCPFKCSFCVYPQTFSSRKLRYRSIQNVIEELKYILKEFKDVKEIMFEDDTLTVDKNRAIEFAQAILKENIKIKWSANSRADIDYETLKILKQAGLRLLCVGIESGNQQILNNINKNLKIEKVEKFFNDAKKAKVKVHGCFILGNKGETKETLMKTLEFAKKLNPDTAQFFPIMVYPGTEAYQWAKQNNYLETQDYKKWLTEDGLHNCIVSTENLKSEELVNFCNYARKKFYLRPKYILQKLYEGIFDINELKRLLKGFLYLIRHLFK